MEPLISNRTYRKSLFKSHIVQMELSNAYANVYDAKEFKSHIVQMERSSVLS